MLNVIPGLGPEPLEGPGTPSGFLNSMLGETFTSPILDLTKTTTGIELVPARPGFVALTQGGIAMCWLIMSKSGTQATPAGIRAGSDPSHNNFITNGGGLSGSPSNADFAASDPPCLSNTINSTFSQPAFGSLIPNAPVILDQPVAATGTGGFSLFARVVVHVYWVAVPQ